MGVGSMTSLNPMPSWNKAAFYAVVAAVLAAIAGFGGVYVWVWAPLSLWLFAASVAVAAWMTVQGRRLPWHPVWIPVLAFGVFIFAQWHWRWSVYPGSTLTELVQLAACGAVFFLAMVAGSQPVLVQRLGWILLVFTGCMSLEAIAQYFTGNGYIYWFHNATYASPVGPYVYHNHYTGCMDLLLPVCLALMFRKDLTRDPWWITWLRRSIVPALAFTSVLISGSRGGVLALLFESLILLVLFREQIWRQRRVRNFVILTALLFCGFAFGGGWKIVSRRFHYLSAHQGRAILTRWQVTQTCWQIWQSHPWLGTGFNTFSTVYPAFQSFDNGKIWLNAHDDFAQALAETGVAGMACVAAFLLLWGWTFYRRKREKTGFAWRVRMGAFVGMAGFLFHSVGDFQFQAPANAFLFFLLAGIFFAPSLNDARENAASPAASKLVVEFPSYAR